MPLAKYLLQYMDLQQLKPYQATVFTAKNLLKEWQLGLLICKLVVYSARNYRINTKVPLW